MFRSVITALLLVAFPAVTVMADTVWYVGQGDYSDGNNPAVEAAFLADPMAGPQIPDTEGFEEPPDDEFFLGISNPLD